MKLSRADILRNILKYKLQQRRRKAAGEAPLKVYRTRRNRCAGCNVLQQRGILSCCNPPLCPDCHKVYNDAPSVRPENQEARRADHNRRRHLKRKALDADGKPIAPRLTRARERSAVDLTGDSDGDADAEDYVGNSGPVVERVHWTLLAAHAQATNERLVAVKREVVDERARADDQGTNAMYLTAQKSELQQLVSDTARALIDADVPTHECPDDATPFYYMLESHRDDGKQTVPWNAEAGRAMSLAEGIEWARTNRPAKRRRRTT